MIHPDLADVWIGNSSILIQLILGTMYVLRLTLVMLRICLVLGTTLIVNVTLMDWVPMNVLFLDQGHSMKDTIE